MAKELNEENLDADFVYDAENWEETWPTDNMCGIEHSTFVQHDWNPVDFAPVEIGRLQKLSSMYAVRLPTRIGEDGEPTDYQITLFDTEDEAQGRLDSWNSDENGFYS